MSRYFFILLFFDAYSGNTQSTIYSKKEKVSEHTPQETKDTDIILNYRKYFKDAGYGDHDGNLGLLKFILNLKLIDDDDKFNLEVILKANHAIEYEENNKLEDKPALSMPEIIDACQTVFYSDFFSIFIQIIVENIPSFLQHKKILKKEYKNDKLSDQNKKETFKSIYKTSLDKYMKKIGEFILNIAINEENLIKNIIIKLGNKLKFVDKVYNKTIKIAEEEISYYKTIKIAKEEISYYLELSNSDSVAILEKARDQLDFAFKNRIKNLKFMKCNNRKSTKEKDVVHIDPNLENNNNNLIYEEIKD